MLRPAPELFSYIILQVLYLHHWKLNFFKFLSTLIHFFLAFKIPLIIPILLITYKT